MSPKGSDFERFSRDLDAEWLRQRLRSVGTMLGAGPEERLVLEALEEADPLGAPLRRPVMTIVKDLWAFWPGRLSFVAVACALVVFGFFLGRVMQDRPTTRVTVIPPRPIITPDDGGSEPRAFGIGAAVKPASQAKFLQAMRFYQSPDFAERALPLLREAVAADSSNDQAQFWLGVVLLLKGQAAEATPPLEEATRLAPGSSVYKQYLLFAYLQTGAVDKAVGVQMQLLEPAPPRR